MLPLNCYKELLRSQFARCSSYPFASNYSSKQFPNGSSYGRSSLCSSTVSACFQTQKSCFRLGLRCGQEGSDCLVLNSAQISPAHPEDLLQLIFHRGKKKMKITNCHPTLTENLLSFLLYFRECCQTREIFF